MRETIEKMAVFTGLLGRAGIWLSGIGLVLMTAFVFAQVFFRYVLHTSLFWAEPAAVMLMGWFIFLGAAVGIREGYHLSFDVLLYFLPERLRPWLHTVSDLVVAGFAVGMVKYGLQLAAKTAHNTIPGLGISGMFDFLPIVGGGVLLVLFCVERILRRAVGLHTSRFGDDHEAEASKTVASEG